MNFKRKVSSNPETKDIVRVTATVKLFRYIVYYNQQSDYFAIFGYIKLVLSGQIDMN